MSAVAADQQVTWSVFDWPDAGDYRFSFILPLRTDMFRKSRPGPIEATGAGD